MITSELFERTDLESKKRLGYDVTTEEWDKRQSLACTDGITLDGMPCMIIGYREPNATVWSRDNHIGVPFSWETIEHTINNKNGEFKS